MELGSNSLSNVSSSSLVNEKNVVGNGDPVEVASQVLQQRLVIGEADEYFTLMPW